MTLTGKPPAVSMVPRYCMQSVRRKSEKLRPAHTWLLASISAMAAKQKHICKFYVDILRAAGQTLLEILHNVLPFSRRIHVCSY